jgi:polyphosphate kinase
MLGMISTKLKFLDRDISILSFNERVLALAQRADYPLLERLKFLCIVASNLDEFFEVRMDAQLVAMRNGTKNSVVTEKTYHEVSQQAHILVAKQYDIFNRELMPALKVAGVDIVASGTRTPAQKKWITNYFQANVKPLLLPIALDLAHPFPLVASKALHFIVELAPVEASNQPTVIIIRVPRALPRVIALPNGHDQKFVTLTSIIGAHLSSFFANRKILSYSQFRVTRHSDIALDEDDMSDLPSALRHELAQRPYGEAVRLEVSQTCSDGLSQFLLNEFRLPYDSLYRVPGPVNLGRLIQLTSLAKGEALAFPEYKPRWPMDLLPRESFFERLKRGEALSHRPYESFDSVLQFLEEAVNDPNVLAIHQTIYRTGSDPRMLNLLQEAVKRGKEVLVVVEIKARFDEETNINWAESLEAIGAQIVYGMLGLKTHAKMLLVMRQEGKRIKRYAHLSTGNYNASTAKLYTDICMFTSDITITREVEYVFRHLTSQVALPRMQKLLVAPFNLQTAMLRQINAAKRACETGGNAKIIAKMNSLTDEVLVKALIGAAQKGVQIDLIVRGACILPIDAPSIEGRVRVRSIVGRFLEHSRVFYFETNGTSRMWLSSADWMSRNMIRRIEIAWPIIDAEMQKRIMQECIAPYLADTEDAWLLAGGGKYLSVSKTMTNSTLSRSAQKILIKRYSLD